MLYFLSYTKCRLYNSSHAYSHAVMHTHTTWVKSTFKKYFDVKFCPHTQLTNYIRQFCFRNQTKSRHWGEGFISFGNSKEDRFFPQVLKFLLVVCVPGSQLTSFICKARIIEFLRFLFCEYIAPTSKIFPPLNIHMNTPDLLE